jgi:glycosyltransferase involved in cell wall biosynthesis
MTLPDIAMPSPIVAEQNKKRILLVVRWPGGGIRTFLRYVYRHFEPNLFHFTILAPDHAELDVLLEDLKGLDVEAVRVSGRPTSFEFFKAITKVVATDNYDLIHSHGFTAGTCAALPAFLFRRKHILTSHDTLSEKQFQGVTGRLKKFGMSVAFSLIQTIHSVSNDAQDNLLEYFPLFRRNSKKCVVIPSGIEVERFVNVKKRNLRAELNVGEETFLVGFLGRFMSVKGFAYLIDAVEELSGINNLPKPLLVICFGEGGYVREDKSLIAERGLSRFFKFLPFAPNVANAIKALDVVAMPSLSEACGLLAMETLVVGTPLIATNCIGLREVVLNTPAHVIPTRDGKALAAGIESFMNNDRKEAFTRFAPEAAQRFDVASQAKKIDELMRSMIEQ